MGWRFVIFRFLFGSKYQFTQSFHVRSELCEECPHYSFAHLHFALENNPQIVVQERAESSLLDYAERSQQCVRILPKLIFRTTLYSLIQILWASSLSDRGDACQFYRRVFQVNPFSRQLYTSAFIVAAKHHKAFTIESLTMNSIPQK